MQGFKVTLLSDKTIEKFVKNMNLSNLKYACSIIVPKYGEIQTAIPYGSSTTNNKILCYNYILSDDKFNSFYIFDRSCSALRTIFDDVDTNNFKYFSGNYEGQFLEEDVYLGSDNVTTPINTYVITKNINFGFDFHKTWRQFIADIKGVGNLTAYTDTGSGWKLIDLETLSGNERTYWKQSLNFVSGRYVRFKFEMNELNSYFSIFNILVKYKLHKIRSS
jgi:hypothetical protein